MEEEDGIRWMGERIEDWWEAMAIDIVRELGSALKLDNFMQKDMAERMRRKRGLRTKRQEIERESRAHRQRFRRGAKYRNELRDNAISSPLYRIPNKN